MRLKRTLPGAGAFAKVYWDQEWREFVTLIFRGGVQVATSFSDCPKDAAGTAAAELERMKPQ